jgi:hypothetical protein
MAALRLVPIAGTFAVCSLSPDGPIPDWAARGSFVSITRTRDELSVVCQEEAVPAGVRSEPGWRGLRIVGTIEFSEVGVLASLVGPLALAGLGVFVLSTFDTDYLLIKEQDFDAAAAALRQHGHAILPEAAEHSATPL